MFSEILKTYKKIYPIRLNMEGSGFGAIVLQTINQIRYCERHNFYPIVAYDAECQSVFFDASKGVELWSQYFEPVMPLSYHNLLKLSDDFEHKIHRLSIEEAMQISEESPDSVYTFPFGIWRSQDLGNLKDWYNRQRAKGRDTVRKYIKPKAHIQEKVAAFYQKHFCDEFVLGVHIRGTDMDYAPIVSPAEYFSHIDNFIAKKPSLKILLATDQAQYLSVFKQRYGERLVFSDSFRSDNEVAPFLREELSPYRKGEDVLIDILLLSKTGFLLKGSSNVGEMALYFNPELDCLDLGFQKEKSFGQEYGKGWDKMTNLTAWELVSKRGLFEVAKDASSQSQLQHYGYQLKKWLRKKRIRAGIFKKKLHTLYQNPLFLLHWLCEPIDKLFTVVAVYKNTHHYQQKGKIHGPYRIEHLPEILQQGFRREFIFINHRLIHLRRPADGRNSCSEDQIPLICKQYMPYVNGNYKRIWPEAMVEELIAHAKSGSDISCKDYPGCALQYYKAIKKYPAVAKKVLVVGSISPWLESVFLAFGALQVTTLEYGPIQNDHPRITTINRLEEPLPAAESFDIICSFSSVEHGGLGRYGEEIKPEGDLDMMNEIFHWLVPGGIAMIGVPVSNKNYLLSNAHRCYSQRYLEERLFSQFDIINVIGYPYGSTEVNYTGLDWQNQPLFTLRKQ